MLRHEHTTMKLHVYDHCPYCVRVRLAFGLKDIAFDLEMHANDDEETLIRMIGRKMLPILEDEDGFTSESLNIIQKIDGLKGERLFDGNVSQALTDWIECWQETIHHLVIPRTPDPMFAEFATPQARAYFTLKKQAAVGDFQLLLDRTPELIAKMEQGLLELETILPGPGDPPIDDLMLFPHLRSLAIVPGLHLPAAIENYQDRVAALGGISIPRPSPPSTSAP